MEALTNLRRALLSNAAFSFTSAVLLLAFPGMVGEWLGLEATGVYRVIGAGLVVFALDLVHQATRRRLATWRALAASLGDFSWVLASLVLLLVAPRTFSGLGVALIGAVAAVVFVFGFWQWRAIRGIYWAPEEAAGTYRLCLMLEVNAPPDAMWRVISDLGSIQRYAPALKSSQLEGEPGVGAVRTCANHADKRWSEECIELDHERRSLALRFLAEAPDFPFPAKSMRGGWTVQPSPAGSQVMIWWELAPKVEFLAPVLLPLFALRADRDFLQVIQRMGEAARRETPTVESMAKGPRQAKAPRQAGMAARLLPQLC